MSSAAVGRAKTEPEDQPMPTINAQPYVHDQVAKDILARAELGERRYGTKLQPNNGRNALQDAYEELLDAATYVKQRMIEDAAPALAYIVAGPGVLSVLECDWDCTVHTSLDEARSSLIECRKTYPDWGIYTLSRVSEMDTELLGYREQ